MKYLQPSFTLPTAAKPMTTEEYEVAVGVRCPKCKALLPHDLCKQPNPGDPGRREG
jgi:hypothetical protein